MQKENARRYGEVASGRLVGGLNTYAYVGGNPISFVDPTGLFGLAEHAWITEQALGSGSSCKKLPNMVAMADFLPGSQLPANSFWHAMSNGAENQSPAAAAREYHNYVADNIAAGTLEGLARALHAVQDNAASGHRGFQAWNGGLPSPNHLRGDVLPSQRSLNDAIQASRRVLGQSGVCGCGQAK